MPLPRPRSAAPGLRDMPRDVVILSVISLCVAVGFGVLVPVLPVFAASFGVGNLAVGAVVSAFAVMRLIISPLCGRMIDWAGERTILAVGIGIVAASSALAGISTSYVQLLCLRGAGGIGSAMFTVSAMTLLLRSVEPALRGRAAALYQGGFLIGGMAGPAVGGLLAAISLTAPFFFYALTLVIAGTVGLLGLTRRERLPQAADGADAPPEDGRGQGAAEAGKRDPADTEPSVPLRTVWADIRYRAACAANLAQGWNSFGVRSSLVPILVVTVLGRPASWTGIAFAVASVAQTLAIGPAGRFVDTRGRRPALIGASLLAGVAMLAVPFAPDIWVLIAILCVYGVASAFLGTAPAAAVGDAAGKGSGRAVAVFSMCSDAGAIVGPLAAGFLADHLSYPVAFGVGAALMIAAGLYAIRIPRRAG